MFERAHSTYVYFDEPQNSWFELQERDYFIMEATLAKTLVNDPKDAVTESIDGFLLTRPDLCRLDGYPGVKVVLRKDVDRSKVALISGGGAGHEPMHGGFVGSGCLTAAVSGDIYASPHTKAVLAAIRAVGSSAGALVIVKNYTGDRLAFGLAAERAIAEGYKVESVYVADDCAVDGGPVTGRRGMAGTIFVHKLAGAVAEAGAGLACVAAVARAVASSVLSVTAALTTCRLPGQPFSSRLEGNVLEFGLGIHGEPGKQRMEPVPPADDLAAAMLRCIAERMCETRGPADTTTGTSPSIPVAVMVNNAGGLSHLEMGIMCLAVHKAITAYNDAHPSAQQLDVQRLYTGTLVTSTDMRGVSLSILPLDGAVAQAVAGCGVSILATPLAALDAPAPHTAWPVTHGGAQWGPTARVPVPPTPAASAAAASHADFNTQEEPTHAAETAALLRCVREACNALIGAKDRLNELDGIAGDADAGNTAALMAEGLLSQCVPAEGSPAFAHLASLPFPSALSSFLSAASDVIGDVAGGSSGTLYALMLQAASRAAAASVASVSSEAAVAAVEAALGAAVEAAQRYGNARPGYRTMLDALVPAHQAMTSIMHDTHASALASAVAAAAAAGAQATADMRARAGRASYVPFERMKGHPDPGALAVGIWMQAVAAEMSGQ